MSVHFTTEFLADLREAGDGRFVGQVLSHLLGPDGSFVPNRDDHRYSGVQDAWIRVVSRGATAYRVIFIRKGADVFLYRAGGKPIEDNLQPPRSLAGSVPLSATPLASQSSSERPAPNELLLKTTEAQFISRHLEAMYHVRHKEICLVSPFIDLELLDSSQPLGRFLDRAVEENTMIILVTCSDQTPDRLPAFKQLEERGINVFFLTRLHTKLYLFEVDLESRNTWQKGVYSHVIVGSSNLTYAGLGFRDVKPNEELNCRLSSETLEDVRTYIARLTTMADDYNKFALNMRRRKP